MSARAEGTAVNSRTWAIIVWGLYLAVVIPVIGLIGAVIGVIIAHVKRADLAGSPFESHMTSAIRTFWIGLLVGTLGFFLTFVGVGIAVLIVLPFWWLFRCIRGLIRAIDGRPIDDPDGLL